MASREKHKRRSSYSYKSSYSNFAGFAHRTAIHNDNVKRSRSMKEAFSNLFAKMKSHNKTDA